MSLIFALGRPAVTLKSALLFVLATPGVLLSGLQGHAFEPPRPPVVFISEADALTAESCLARAIYYEAGFEPLDGKEAVAQVIVNRVNDPAYPDTVCGVVYQGSGRRTGCQFSFACDGSERRRPPTKSQLSAARSLAHATLKGFTPDEVGEATHYHADYVEPYWAPSLIQVKAIGHHVFYRKPAASDGARLSA